MTEPRRRRRNEAIETILRYLGKRIGENVFCTDIVEATGLTEEQIRASIYNARSKHETLRKEIEVITTGRVWRYRPRPIETPAKPTPVASLPTSAAPPEPPPAPATTHATNNATRTNNASRVLYEEVGELDGCVIVRGEDGQYYKIEPIMLKLS